MVVASEGKEKKRTATQSEGQESSGDSVCSQEPVRFGLPVGHPS